RSKYSLVIHPTSTETLPMPEHQQIQQSKKPDTYFQKQATPVIQTPVSNPYSIIQRAKINPKSLTHADVMQLQRTIGNRAVAQLLSGIVNSSSAQQATVQRREIPEEETCPSCVQRQEIPEEEEPLQGKFAEPIQRQEIPEEEEPLQGKMIETIQRQEIPEEEEPLQGRFKEPIQRQEIPEEEKPLQGKFENKPDIACPSCSATPIVQRQEILEEEEPLQGKMIGIVQRQEIPEEEEPLQTKRENNTGMPDNLKAGVESLSGIDMSDVRVHYNSDKPAEVGALAYTQGTNIHVAPGQERHLPHEAWHVVQQKQGRVSPTGEVKGLPLNDSRTLESEADLMGGGALQRYEQVKKPKENKSRAAASSIVQKKSSVKQGFGFVDNRPAAVAERKQQEKANNSHQVDQMAFQEKANNSPQAKQVAQLQAMAYNYSVDQTVQPQKIKIHSNGSHLIQGLDVIQRMAFSDPASPNRTRQWEGHRSTPWRARGQERPPAVAAKVDQFKKEILTYIAHFIEAQKSARYYGPHIAVIITGGKWNVSVNSDVSTNKQGNLPADAQSAKGHIDACWANLNNIYHAGYFSKRKPMGLLHSFYWKMIQNTDEEANEEAVYYAFRWAANKTVNAIQNPLVGVRRDGRVIHGEMKIIEYLKNLPFAWAAKVPPVGVPPNWRRVVRVGGTKTPCLDCAWEMDKVPLPYDQAQINTGTGGAHSPTHDAHKIGADPNERVVTTMSPEFGFGFPTWQSTDQHLARRITVLKPNEGGAPPATGYKEDQAQNYDALRAAYIATKCVPDMI
ncbi:MAG: DUF4157 domain-containing protein, partial [Methanosarcina vacuolata]|nr:DUF4157 domain-containing protein [Methanosarcina vacuolata]